MIKNPTYYGMNSQFKKKLFFYPKLSTKQHIFVFIILIQLLFGFIFLYFHLICPLIVTLNQRFIDSALWPSSDSLKLNRNGEIKSSGNRIAYIFAHPDDESMFFTPSIRRLLKDKNEIYFLCFTTNFKKFMSSPNENRGLELQRAAHVLGVSDDFKILSIMNMDDYESYGRVTAVGLPGENEDWFLKKEDMQNILETFLTKYEIDAIITFDPYGVSGHPEHFKVRTAVLEYKKNKEIEVFELITYNKIIKFTGLIGSILFRDSNIVLYTDSVDHAWNAMVEHVSQWTWFRKFFISHSRYAYINNLRKIN